MTGRTRDELPPLMRQQALRLSRLGWQGWGLILLVWVPATYFLRSYLWNNFLASMLGPTSALLLDSMLPWLLRPEIPLALVLFHTLHPTQEWQALREQLGVSLLTAREVAAGLLAGPLAVLLGLNLLAGLPSYLHLLTEIPGTYPIPRREAIAWAVLVMGLATLEDLLFSAVCAVAFLRERLRDRGETNLGSLRAFRFILGVGLAIVGLSILTLLWTVTISGWLSLPEAPRTVLLLTGILPMGVVYWLEGTMVWKAFQESEEWADRWLRGEEDEPPLPGPSEEEDPASPE